MFHVVPLIERYLLYHRNNRKNVSSGIEVLIPANTLPRSYSSSSRVTCIILSIKPVSKILYQLKLGLVTNVRSCGDIFLLPLVRLFLLFRPSQHNYSYIIKTKFISESQSNGVFQLANPQFSLFSRDRGANTKPSACMPNAPTSTLLRKK